MTITLKNKIPDVHNEFHILGLVHLPTEIKLTVCNQIILNFRVVLRI